jgi:tetratricopeptide (TPR) repeat protein
LQKTPSLIKKWAPLFEDFSFSREEIATALPNSVDAWIQYGVSLEKIDNIGEAEHYFNTALSFLEYEKQIKPYWFQTLIEFYRKKNQPERALLILRQATGLVPGHASFHIQLGDYYRTEGIIYRAKEEYQRALMIDPGNRTVTRRLRQMGLSDSY